MDNLNSFVFVIYALYLNSCSISMPVSDKMISVEGDLKTEVTSYLAKRNNNIQRLTVPIREQLENSDSAINYIQSDHHTELPTARILVTVRRRSSRYWEPWELNRGVCPPSLCPSNSEKRPRGTADTVFYNGDIVLDKEYEKIIYGGDLSSRLRLRFRRATTRSSSRLWKDGIVPYTFSDTILPKSQRAINKAMKEIENQTCIRFRKKKLRDEDFVRFISEPGCWSSVGKLGGEQRLSIGRGCERVGIAIHEISHALGLWHEQARPDRDRFVKVLEENISPRYLPDFNKANKTLVTSLGYPYDYESVMHYSKKAFTNLGDVTIAVIGVGKKLNMTIGQREALSTIDIAQLRDMYNCNDKEDKNVTFCPKGWMKKKRSCYKFEDKKIEQFAGATKHCEDLNSKLLIIDNERENKLIRKILKSKYPDISTWRTAGRVVNGSFVWYTGSKGKPQEMTYTNWAKKMPGPFSSMIIVRNKTTNKLKWEGAWLGSFKQMPEHAHNFICERRARRKCIAGEFKDGRDYRGTLDHTIDGITCQKWSSQYPHRHKLLAYPYEETNKKNPDGLGDHNYCRNPAGARKTRPWCYTTKKNFKWQYCDISVCSNKADNSVQKVSNNLGGLDDEPSKRDVSDIKKRNSNRTDKNNRKDNRTDKNNRKGNRTDKNNKKNNRKGNDSKDKNRNKKNERKNKTEKDTRKNNKADKKRRGEKRNRRSKSNRRKNNSRRNVT